MKDYIANLIQAIKLSGEAEAVERVETHISWVLLTGKYAYKIKKPVNLGFLDFSTLEKRHFYCQEELRLNSRLAPTIYLDVVPITGSVEKPVLGGNGAVIDYAVKMKQFPAQSELTHVVEQNQLKCRHIDRLAEILADFHQRIDRSSAQTIWGTPEQAHHATQDTFECLLRNVSDQNDRLRVEKIYRWINDRFDSHKADFQQRHDQGFVRECHGDLHLGNIALVDDDILIFDGIEFSESLRWIDVISEIAFLMMDLQYRNLQPKAYRFLNAYLEQTGDYAGLKLLRYYLVYRAIVRAMVAALRARQSDVSTPLREALQREYRAYLDLAESYIKPQQPVLLLCHGFSASGKSTITQIILENLPAIRLRSDVERKRLFGVKKQQKTHSAIGQNVYSKQATELTYDRLKALAEVVLQSGYHVIVDATFLSRRQRRKFYEIGQRSSCQWIIIDFVVAEDILRARIEKRCQNQAEVSEADSSVLDYQLKNHDPLDRYEQKFTCKIDAEKRFVFSTFKKQLEQCLILEK
ncbi:AAA family ATPase [methane-oxidizing endosymbiont of Gigantopelta aegis]|uniref:bifunctional aminoglycoside phosphotransferase/ATP-binding protein n=1 Tax=methane-oxidizing endosymbiont of Gigantopelta aegis TaxID=2794938 RepID=UPI0018DC4A86|nr:bifunctional aminoglycoside phosphotransferase/ATP-binding protein [methane-oxidizing endosymbiont of Gigantopelta aegis]